MVVLVPERVGGVQVLEVLDEVGAVEDAGAQVGRQRREPRAAEDAAAVAHRVVVAAVLPGAAPVRHRRAVDDDRPRVVGVRRREHHRRPAALAVADDRRLRARRMPCAHLAHERLLGLADVEQRLAGLGVAEEDHEVHRVPGTQRDADLRVVLEAADAGAVPGARVDDQVRTALRVHRHALGRNDAHQRVVDRARQLAAVDDRLVLEVEHRRQSRPRVLDEVVAALAQRVPEQHGPLRGVGGVVVPLRPRGQRRCGILLHRARQRRAGLAEPLAVVLLRELDPLFQQLRDLAGDFVTLRGELRGVHDGSSGGGGCEAGQPTAGLSNPPFHYRAGPCVPIDPGQAGVRRRGVLRTAAAPAPARAAARHGSRGSPRRPGRPSRRPSPCRR